MLMVEDFYHVMYRGQTLDSWKYITQIVSLEVFYFVV